MTTYQDFLARKRQLGGTHGFEPLWLPDFLHGFQAHLSGWAVRKGRAAILADCGLGKTPMFLVWAENVVRHTSRPVLALTTLGDSLQTVSEADKFGVDAARSRDGKVAAGARVVVTNYERLHLFDPDGFAGVVCNESSILKNFEGKTKAAVTEFLRTVPYRLLCTATAAPNDYAELGTSAEALGEMGHQDMLSRFYRQTNPSRGDAVGWGRVKHVLRKHAERDFWRWVCSWARACRRPSDLGFDDGPFVLPGLTETEHVLPGPGPGPGELFPLPAATLQEQKGIERRTVEQRCEKVAELAAAFPADPYACWVHRNAEGDLLERLIPGAVQVSGRDSDDEKEEKILAFSSGQARVLITKQSVCGFGLNWQHCHRLSVFPSDSFEGYYQLVRRFLRFGQTQRVLVDIVTTEGVTGVLANLRRKCDAADRMFSMMVELMNDALKIDRPAGPDDNMILPSWMVNN